MNRRGFLKALGIGAGVTVAGPALSWVPTPLPRSTWVPVDHGKAIYARITISGPTIYHLGRDGVFVSAMNGELKRISQDMKRRGP